MMQESFKTAFTAGYERLCAWAELLDQINVFPVADADTGRNLIVSLAPLRDIGGDADRTAGQLLMSATGNSGNIANCFFAGFIATDPVKEWFRAAQSGRDRAWQAIVDPKPGTMLSVFDALADHFHNLDAPNPDEFFNPLIDQLQEVTLSTAEVLPALKAAGVVDAGALGIYIFMEGFFGTLAGRTDALRPVTETFSGKLDISPSYKAQDELGFCVDTVIQPEGDAEGSLSKLADIGDSIVVTQHSQNLKIHFHTGRRADARKRLQKLGRVVEWSEQEIRHRVADPTPSKTRPKVHIVTDAAGSITRHDAGELGMTLLNSYILTGDGCLPETLVSSATLYRTMREGIRVTTAQASVFERRQQYQSIVSRYRHALYLCVGSVYTGNCEVARNWQETDDPQNRLTILDTGSASGRLGIIALAVARFANQGHPLDKVVRFAEKAVRQSEEYIFLHRLKYLAAGGRISKSKGFMGDFLNLRPIISPTDKGAVKVGTARNSGQQLEFALEKIKSVPQGKNGLSIMLEYSDNRKWVKDTVLPEIRRHHTAARIMLQPLSLTSGVHMGPGTWAVAMLPAISID